MPPRVVTEQFPSDPEIGPVRAGAPHAVEDLPSGPYGPWHWSHVEARVDAKGREYLVDASGTRLDKGRRGPRPPCTHTDAWARMKQHEKDEAVETYREILRAPKSTSDVATHGPEPPSHGSSSSALAIRSECPLGVSALGLPPPQRVRPSLRWPHREAPAGVAMAASLGDQADAPVMPKKSRPDSGHRAHVRPPEALWNILVARPVTRKEALGNPAAHEAVMKEWDELRKQRVWDEKRVKPWAEVRAEAKRTGRTIHVGRIFDICVEKNHELPQSDARRKFKGRVVFGGNNVRDQN